MLTLIIISVIKILVVFVVFLLMIAYLTWLERKLLGHFKLVRELEFPNPCEIKRIIQEMLK